MISSDELFRTNVHSPESRLNSKVHSLSTPGPRLLTPSFEGCLTPEFVITETSNPPIGTGASFEIEIIARTTSSSSSLISILTLMTSAFNEPLLPEVGTPMSLAYLATNATILEANHTTSA